MSFANRIRVAAAALLFAATPAYAAFDFGDIICETTTTTGTGTLSLGGAVTNYVTFVSQIASGAVVPYHIRASDGTLETGTGTFTDAAPDTLTRVADWSTNGSGAELTLPAGTHTVCVGPIASIFNGAKGFQLYTADAGAVGGVLPFWHDSATPALNDYPANIHVYAGADDEIVGELNFRLIDGATTTEDGAWEFWADVAGTGALQASVGNGVIIGSGTTFGGAGTLTMGGNILLGADATYDIGTSTVGINDLHIGGTGGVINFDGGDVTITHAANDLTFAGVTGEYEFDDSIVPNADATNDLGTSTVGWNDLHLGSGGIINLDGGDVTLTHAANILSFEGGDMLLGTTTEVAGRSPSNTALDPIFEISTTSNQSTLEINRFSADGSGPLVVFGKGRDASVGSFGVVTSGDDAGQFVGTAADGTDFAALATITFEVDGTPGSDDMPGRISFGTTADGAATVTNHFTLYQDGCLASANALNTNTGNCATGQINADAVYDDDVALTSMPLSDTFRNTGTFSVEEWDAKHNKNRKIPAIELGEQGFQPEAPDWEEHKAARHFKKMLDEGFDPRNTQAWLARMRADKVLPGMPTEQEWEEHGEYSLGELYSRMWLTLDMIGLQIENQQAKIDALEARIEALERRANGNPNN